MNELKKYLWQKKMMKIKYILICILGFDRVKYLKQHNVFAELGDNVLYQPIKLPNEPKLIKIHNNVKVAADVTFYTHDVINSFIYSYLLSCTTFYKINTILKHPYNCFSIQKYNCN